MKICMFTNTYLPHVGGVAYSVQTFAQDLRQMGNQVLVIAPVFPGSKAHDQEEDGILRVPAIQEVNGSDFSVKLPVPFLIDEKIDDFHPDIIHSHHPYLLGDSAFRAAKKHRLPLVFTLHTIYEAYTHHLNMDTEAVQKFAAVLSCEYANLCSLVIAPSRSILKMMQARGVNRPIIEIPTGVDIGFFNTGDSSSCRKKYHIAGNTKVIGHVGRLSQEKNLIYLARAVADTVMEIEDTVFLVVGEGSLKAEIQTVFDRHGASSKLICTDSLSGRQLVDAYQAMDLFAFSSHSETQGMVLTEAMAAGCPVIALDAPGVREVVKDRENGRLLNKDSSHREFARHLKESILDAENLAKWGDKARQTADLFSRQSSAGKLYTAYQGVMQDHEPGPEGPGHDLARWESLLLGLEAEWELLIEKAKAVVQTVKKTHEKNSE